MPFSTEIRDAAPLVAPQVHGRQAKRRFRRLTWETCRQVPLNLVTEDGEIITVHPPCHDVDNCSDCLRDWQGLRIKQCYNTRADTYAVYQMPRSEERGFLHALSQQRSRHGGEYAAVSDWEKSGDATVHVFGRVILFTGIYSRYLQKVSPLKTTTDFFLAYVKAIHSLLGRFAKGHHLVRASRNFFARSIADILSRAPKIGKVVLRYFGPTLFERAMKVIRQRRADGWAAFAQLSSDLRSPSALPDSA